METVHVVLDGQGTILGVFLNEECAEDCVADNPGATYESHTVEDHYMP